MAISTTGADTYFASRLNSSAWDSATVSDKQKALSQAERQLEPYRARCEPTRFSYAVYEQALFLLQGDVRSQLQQSGVVSASIGNTSETYKPRHDPCIAPQAWAYIRGPSRKAGGLR